jgi:hypothetical protein
MVRLNVEIMRAFVRLRRIHGEHADLVRRLDARELRYDKRSKLVFDALDRASRGRSTFLLRSR